MDTGSRVIALPLVKSAAAVICPILYLVGLYLVGLYLVGLCLVDVMLQKELDQSWAKPRRGSDLVETGGRTGIAVALFRAGQAIQRRVEGSGAADFASVRKKVLRPPVETAGPIRAEAAAGILVSK
jgi:hypothetical protein